MPSRSTGPSVRLQTGAVERPDRLPVQPEEAGHMQNRRHTTQARHRVGQPTRHACIRRQPRQPFQLRAARLTGHAHPRHDQLDGMLKHRQIAHPAFLQIVNETARPTAAAAAPRSPANRRQPNHAPAPLAARLVPIVSDLVTFPASQPGHRLAQGHGRPPANLMSGNTKSAAASVRPPHSSRKSEKNLFFACASSSNDFKRAASTSSSNAIRRRRASRSSMLRACSWRRTSSM